MLLFRDLQCMEQFTIVHAVPYIFFCHLLGQVTSDESIFHYDGAQNYSFYNPTNVSLPSFLEDLVVEKEGTQELADKFWKICSCKKARSLRLLFQYKFGKSSTSYRPISAENFFQSRKILSTFVITCPGGMARNARATRPRPEPSARRLSCFYVWEYFHICVIVNWRKLISFLKSMKGSLAKTCRHFEFVEFWLIWW